MRSCSTVAIGTALPHKPKLGPYPNQHDSYLVLDNFGNVICTFVSISLTNMINKLGPSWATIGPPLGPSWALQGPTAGPPAKLAE